MVKTTESKTVSVSKIGIIGSEVSFALQNELLNLQIQGHNRSLESFLRAIGLKWCHFFIVSFDRICTILISKSGVPYNSGSNFRKLIVTSLNHK